jgi:hypothetical protein
MPSATLYKWQRSGWVHSRKAAVALGRLALWADDDELARLRQLRLYKRQWPDPHYPASLTSPKNREEGDRRCVVSKPPSGVTGP